MGKVPPSDRRRSRVIRSGWLVCLCLVATSTWAASFEPGWGRDGMVVTSVSPAAPVGRAVLERGGNAFDAAIATAFAAAVAHPFSSGLGGGMFAVAYEAASGQQRALDARETAPAGANADFYQENPDAIRTGAHSVGVPGLVQGLWALHQAYGTLPWDELLKPAIEMASEGVEVSIWHHNVVRWVEDALAEHLETRRIQTVEGKSPPLGWNLVQADLAETLRLIGERGEKALALGPIASKIEQATNGAITELDLARYKVKWREPVTGSYRGYQVVAMPPPSSGGVLLVQMLNILERHDLASLGHNSGRYIHLVASAMKLAFADRALHLGDPDFYQVPVDRLISREYADRQAKRLRADAPPRVDVDLKTPPDDAGTTHISVLDRHGNAVALTQTINTIFGSKITVPGTGIVLNNELDDFSVGPELANAWEALGGAANGIQPGKRPLSSMTPVIVLKEGRPVMVVGSPMGTKIISAVLLSLVNAIDFDLDAADAVNLPRFHHQWQPDQLQLEPEFPVEVRRGLEELGWTLSDTSMIGAAELAVFDPESCMFWGGADGRRDSGAAGANAQPVSIETLDRACAIQVGDSARAVPR